MPLHPDIERIALIGWHVFPGSSRTRAACFKGASEQASCDLDVLEQWSAEYPRCSWRLRMGQSGIWGLDLDVPSPWHAHDGVEAFKRLVDGRPIPPRPMLRSGGGGLALFFAYTGGKIRGDSGRVAAGIDPRRGPQSQTIPPSAHYRNAVPYRWIVPPWEVPPPPAPEWLFDLFREPELPPPEKPRLANRNSSARRSYAVAALHNATRRVAAAQKGSRNDTLNRECYSVAKFLSDGTLTESEIRECMLAASRICAPEEVRASVLTIDSALRATRRA